MSVEEKLREAFAPSLLEIIDESHKHAGHKGNTGGSHLLLKIESEAFTGLTQMQRHRLIYKALADDMKGTIHALQIEARSPKDA